MTVTNRKRLFPLYLSPIEAFLRVDDHPLYPMDFILDTGFEGVIDRDAFLMSLGEALVRHPLLQSVIQTAKRGRPCWVYDRDRPPQVDWGSMEKPIELEKTEYIDLTEEVGLRIWCRTSDSRTRIVWQFHHACTDGIGAYRFIGDLLALYGTKMSRENLPELAPIDPESLKNRHHRVTELAYTYQRFAIMKRAVKMGAYIFFKGIQPLAIPDSKPKPKSPVFPGIEVLKFEKEEHERIREASIQMGCTVNDMLLACLLESLHRWNLQQGVKKQKPWLRIMMPTDMRETCDYATPAANLMSYTFIDRPTNQCNDAQGMISGIRSETALIKHERRGVQFCDAVATTTMVSSKILPYLLSRPRCVASVVLSNVGDPVKRFTASFPRKGGKCVAGNLVLDEFTGVPPLRPGTHVTISITSFLRRLCISMRCDMHQFTPETTREFLQLYAETLWKLTEKNTPSVATENTPAVRS